MAASTKIAWARISTEAIAIIASILVAFGIDAWWEGKQETALGIEYEDRIAAELRRSLVTLNEQLVYTEAYILAANEAAYFFDGDKQAVSGEKLIIGLYNMGRDPYDQFDISTYDDLVATGRVGLIRNVERREAIQRAYSEIKELEPIMRPYRNEYLTGIRGWIPQSVFKKIREVCPDMLDSIGCSDIDFDIDARVVENIVVHFSSDSATLAYRLRVQGLSEKLTRVGATTEAVVEALAQLE
jgi:hypothetical protein